MATTNITLISAVARGAPPPPPFLKYLFCLSCTELKQKRLSQLLKGNMLVTLEMVICYYCLLISDSQPVDCMGPSVGP